MSTFKNIVVAGGLALATLAATAPAADARVSVGVGIGIGGGYHHRHFCRHHPYECGRGGYVAGPRIGVFYGGRGWWDGHRYWGHRYRWHGGWRYR